MIDAMVRLERALVLPKQSPWLNAIKPKWVHGKRKVVESDGCLEPTSLPIGYAGCSVVRITSISPLHRRSLDHALGPRIREVIAQPYRDLTTT
jgi:hypothetical protein